MTSFNASYFTDDDVARDALYLLTYQVDIPTIQTIKLFKPWICPTLTTQKAALNNFSPRKASIKFDLGFTDPRKVNLGIGGPTDTMISIGAWNKMVNI